MPAKEIFCSLAHRRPVTLCTSAKSKRTPQSKGFLASASISALVDPGAAHKHRKSHSRCEEESCVTGSGRKNSCCFGQCTPGTIPGDRNRSQMCPSIFSESSKIRSHRAASFSPSVWATTRRTGICCTSRESSSNSSARCPRSINRPM